MRLLRHILRIFSTVPLWGPIGPDWKKIAHAKLNNGANNIGP